MGWFLLPIALLGHAFLWIGLINRLHSIRIRRRTIKRITVVFFALALTIPLAVTRSCAAGVEQANVFAAVYVALCLAVAPVTLLRWFHLRCFRHPRAILRREKRALAAIDPTSVAEKPEELEHHPLTRLPLNEVLQLETVELDLALPRLPAAIEGLTIVHLSDLHFTGRIGKAYFREVVRVANQLQPDLMCLTGDLIDEPDCLAWIPDTLGRLNAKYGVYFVLGNHDLYVDCSRLRQRLTENGLSDLGGRAVTISIRETSVLLAGNEWPWFASWRQHAWIPVDWHRCLPPREASPNLRIALAHTPDQYAWARVNDVDLLLTGHTHGGQIRIPPLGAIFSPSITGVKHIAGVYYDPPTVMHVTRGISGDVPVRWNCRPEIARIRLISDRHDG